MCNCIHIKQWMQLFVHTELIFVNSDRLLINKTELSMILGAITLIWRHYNGTISIHWGRDKWATFGRRRFQVHFLKKKNEIHWQIASTGSDNILAPKKQPAFTDGGLCCWRIYASLGLNELKQSGALESYLYIYLPGTMYSIMKLKITLLWYPGRRWIYICWL